MEKQTYTWDKRQKRATIGFALLRNLPPLNHKITVTWRGFSVILRHRFSTKPVKMRPKELINFRFGKINRVETGNFRPKMMESYVDVMEMLWVKEPDTVRYTHIYTYIYNILTILIFNIIKLCISFKNFKFYTLCVFQNSPYFCYGLKRHAHRCFMHIFYITRKFTEVL